jgi:hypothetical protein
MHRSIHKLLYSYQRYETKAIQHIFNMSKNTDIDKNTMNVSQHDAQMATRVCQYCIGSGFGCAYCNRGYSRRPPSGASNDRFDGFQCMLCFADQFTCRLLGSRPYSGHGNDDDQPINISDDDGSTDHDDLTANMTHSDVCAVYSILPHSYDDACS